MKGSKRGPWIHCLSQIDKEGKTANCAACGRVKVSLHAGKWRCAVGHKAANRRSQHNIPDSCEICESKVPLVYDHCHTKGHHRGWLCHPCNKMLGFAKDNPVVLTKAIEYLKNRG